MISLPGRNVRESGEHRLHKSGWILLITSWLSLLAFAADGSPASAVIPPIASIADLSVEEAKLGHPVELPATVTFYDSTRRFLFIQDGTNGLFVLTGAAELSIKPGDRVRVTGPSALGSYVPMLVEPNVVRLGGGEVPVPRPSSLSEMISGVLDGQSVEVAGVIRRIVERDGRCLADLATGEGTVKVLFGRSGPESSLDLVGSEVQVTGACLAVADEERRVAEVRLFVSDPSAVTVSRSAPGDPFHLPRTAIADLLVTSGADARLGLVHLGGGVTSSDGGKRFWVQDASGEIEIRTESIAGVRPGQSVEVVGFQSLAPGETRVEFARVSILNPTSGEVQLRDGLQGVDADSSAGRVLGTAQEVRRLSKAEAERGLPVKLRAVVTYYDPERSMLFIQDETAGIYVNPGAARHDMRFGDRVEVSGVSNPGEFAPMVSEATIKLLGPGTLPKPLRGELTHLLTGADDSQWVEVTGIVRSVIEDEGHWVLEIAQSPRTFRVMIPGVAGRETPKQLVDATIRVQGACGSIFNQRRQLLGILVYAPDPSFVDVEVKAPAEPWLIPSQSIGSLLQFDPNRASGHRTGIKGVVTLTGRDDEFFVQDDTGSLKLKALPDLPVQAGDEVEVIGFPALGDYEPVLEDSVYRVVGQRKIPDATYLTIAEALNIDTPAIGVNNRRVRVRGVLVDVVSSGAGLVLLLKDGEHLMEAAFESDLTRDSVSHLKPGSVLNLTGVCALRRDHTGQPLTVRLQMTSLEDVMIVASAPWWKSRHMGRVAYMAGLIGLACVAWLLLLRRQVRQQSQTLRQRLERELALERRERTLTQHSVVGIWQLAPDGRTVYINPAMRRLLELDDNTDFLQRHADSFLPGLVDLGGPNNGSSPEVATVSAREAEVVTVTGKRRAVLASVAPIVDPAGRVESWIGTAVDITPIKVVETELARARDMALESARLKSEFLANMSHEIRTPMNGVIGMIELLLRTPLNRVQKDFARTVRDSAEVLLTLINDILDFSKIEAGRLELDEVDFELREVVESTIQLLSHRAIERGLGFGSLVGHDVPSAVRGDPTRLRQVLLNLLNNAIKFTDQGEVFLEVSRQNVDGAIGLRFEVHDTGIGISDQARSQLFQPFVQADGSTTRKYGGTGLGLAICRQLVRMFKGEIGLNSEPGRGSVFWFTVRLGQATGPVLNPPANPEFFAGKRAIVVDDNAINRRIVRHHLEEWGMASDEEALPEAALERLAASAEMNLYDVAILDMQMPVMDGLMLAQHIRSIPALARLPILLLTSMGQDLDRSTLESLGIREWLSKPYRQDDLCRRLTRLLCIDETQSRSPDTGLAWKPLEDSAPNAGALAAGGALRVLVAEDNAVNRKVAIHQLAALGFVPDVASDGVEAVAAFRRLPYQVILMDCQMPRMDGYEATRRIREMEKGRPEAGRSAAKIIAMTAHAMAGDREKCLSAGMDLYLSKPLVIGDLRVALEKAMADGDSRAPVTSAQEDTDAPAVLSSQTLDRIRELGSDALLEEIVDLYLGETPNLVAQMREAWQAGDRSKVERLAHTLKGSASNVGADRFASILRDVEQRSRDESRLADEGQMAELQAAFECTRDAMRDLSRRAEV